MYAEPVKGVGDRTPPAGEGVWAEARAKALVGIACALIAGTPYPTKGAPPAWRHSVPNAVPT